MTETLDQTTDQSLRALITESGMPLKLFSEAIGTSAEDVLKWWSTKSCSLSTKNLESLSLFLGISESNLLNSDRVFRTSLVRSRMFLGPQTLPENYALHAGTYVRTSVHIVEYLAMVYGRRFADQALLNLNIHPLYFENLENKINLTFYIDMFNELDRLGLHDAEIASLGFYIFLKLQDTKLGEYFKRARTYEESYWVLAQHATMFESNFEYDFQISRDKIRIVAKPTKANLFIAGRDSEYYRRLFMYRKNVFSWFPILSSLAPLELKSVRCLMNGDDRTVYEAAFPDNSRNMNLKLLLGGQA
jgi:hypothetical protein